MSRHAIPALDPRHKVIVGWDHPLQTYFAQVIDRAAEGAGSDDKMVLWKGTRLRELYEIDQLAHVLRRHARLETEMRSMLYGDKDDGR
jgi:hypothetical protein